MITGNFFILVDVSELFLSKQFSFLVFWAVIQCEVATSWMLWCKIQNPQNGSHSIWTQKSRPLQVFTFYNSHCMSLKVSDRSNTTLIFRPFHKRSSKDCLVIIPNQLTNSLFSQLLYRSQQFFFHFSFGYSMKLAKREKNDFVCSLNKSEGWISHILSSEHFILKIRMGHPEIDRRHKKPEYKDVCILLGHFLPKLSFILPF